VTNLQTVATAEMKSETQHAKPNLDLAKRFEYYYPRIYSYLRYRLSSVEDTEDLIGAIFERAYARRDRFDSSKGAFSTWLFRIARNMLVDHYRQRQRRLTWEIGADISVDLVTPEPLPEAQMIHHEALLIMLRCLERLSERDQEIISLKFAGKLRNNEISEIMEMREKTVSVVLLRAVRRLRQEMELEAAL
jgi:RNA polymerase sigma-70 factor (ECF subfamily)